MNLLTTANDNVSLASSSSPEHRSELTVPPDRCATCGKLSAMGDNSDDDEIEMNGRKTSESDEDCITMKPKMEIHNSGFGMMNGDCGTTNYLIAVHRNLCRQDTYFLSHHKTRPGLFGVPLLIPCYEGVTNKQLYCAVWTQVSRLLSKLPPTPPDQANHATDCDDSLGYDFPFTLKAVAEGGRVCCLCPWSKFCRGCEIPCNDEPLLDSFLLKNGEWIQLITSNSNPNSNRIQTLIRIHKNFYLQPKIH